MDVEPPQQRRTDPSAKTPAPSRYLRTGLAPDRVKPPQQSSQQQQQQQRRPPAGRGRSAEGARLHLAEPRPADDDDRNNRMAGRGGRGEERPLRSILRNPLASPAGEDSSGSILPEQYSVSSAASSSAAVIEGPNTRPLESAALFDPRTSADRANNVPRVAFLSRPARNNDGNESGAQEPQVPRRFRVVREPEQSNTPDWGTPRSVASDAERAQRPLSARGESFGQGPNDFAYPIDDGDGDGEGWLNPRPGPSGADDEPSNLQERQASGLADLERLGGVDRASVALMRRMLREDIEDVQGQRQGGAGRGRAAGRGTYHGQQMNMPNMPNRPPPPTHPPPPPPQAPRPSLVVSRANVPSQPVPPHFGQRTGLPFPGRVERGRGRENGAMIESGVGIRTGGRGRGAPFDPAPPMTLDCLLRVSRLGLYRGEGDICEERDTRLVDDKKKNKEKEKEKDKEKKKYPKEKHPTALYSPREDAAGPQPSSSASSSAANDDGAILKGKGGQDDLCVICQQGFHIGSIVRRLLCCRKYYHVYCIDDWLKATARCPLCNQTLSDFHPPQPQQQQRGVPPPGHGAMWESWRNGFLMAVANLDVLRHPHFARGDRPSESPTTQSTNEGPARTFRRPAQNRQHRPPEVSGETASSEQSYTLPPELLGELHQIMREIDGLDTPALQRRLAALRQRWEHCRHQIVQDARQYRQEQVQRRQVARDRREGTTDDPPPPQLVSPSRDRSRSVSPRPRPAPLPSTSGPRISTPPPPIPGRPQFAPGPSHADTAVRVPASMRREVAQMRRQLTPTARPAPTVRQPYRPPVPRLDMRRVQAARIEPCNLPYPPPSLRGSYSPRPMSPARSSRNRNPEPPTSPDDERGSMSERPYAPPLSSTTYSRGAEGTGDGRDGQTNVETRAGERPGTMQEGEGGTSGSASGGGAGDADQAPSGGPDAAAAGEDGDADRPPQAVTVIRRDSSSPHFGSPANSSVAGSSSSESEDDW
ncbi:unnamed protein product [Vitrella brassicaformis CCMP3155]|uniref:RING-type domain-containing protein n=2 Tax=Vitrella brassicaformis TaxID=1169539 RepID=A0A0G4F4W5_VITBC|nr:unnamed protein product [Vitrella brassicaformis CCMP3155]|eukprot:CEM07190.1 unnamed protein product [Vitrella brassicaformis CCMP3155]